MQKASSPQPQSVHLNIYTSRRALKKSPWPINAHQSKIDSYEHETKRTAKHILVKLVTECTQWRHNSLVETRYFLISKCLQALQKKNTRDEPAQSENVTRIAAKSHHDIFGVQNRFRDDFFHPVCALFELLFVCGRTRRNLQCAFSKEEKREVNVNIF